MNAELNTVKEQQKDPVGKMVVSSKSKHQDYREGQYYYFCIEHCLHKFKEHPEQYLDKEISLTHQTGDDSTVYTCPMHLDIQHHGPGSCPKCGMPLEAVTVNLEEKNEELIDMSRRFWVSTVLALPVFILAMIADLLPAWLPAGLSMQRVQWIEFVLATPVVLWGGWPFFVRGWQSVKTWNLNMFTLISLGISVAWIYSLVALLFPPIFPPTMRMEGALLDVYFEAAAVITALVLLGQVLELRARSQTNAAIRMLIGLSPNTARIVRKDGMEEDIPLEQVKPGDTLRLRPGEKVPVDATVIDGENNVNESMVTAEPVPVQSRLVIN